MKYILTALLLCFTCFGHTQNLAYHFTEEDLQGAWASDNNYDYLDKVIDNTTPDPVMVLENEAARYDMEEIDPRYKRVERRITFSHTRGRVIAVYDHQGKILKSYEKYVGISPPQKMVRVIARNYPGWTISASTYRVYYLRDKGKAHKRYRIRITKGSSKKNLRLDEVGNIL